MFDLSGKTALITGASGGIGEEIARTYHKAGATIVISGTRREKLEALQHELGANVFIETCNLSIREEVATLIDRAASHTGKIDILVCNAGITRDKLLISMKEEDFLEVINVNLLASFVLNRDAVKKMMKQKWGRIINISSVIGSTGNPGQANYAASKAGLQALTKSIAQEVASRGITANTIAPGFIISPMTESLKEEYKNALIEKIPARKLGVPADIAAAALYLASEEASYVNGHNLHVNGGMYVN
jgi:3-oxoacyl-[acyl-carrier protein] reductase